MATEAPWVRHPDGITTVDAFYTRPAYAAVHVIEKAGRAALVDTGTNESVPHVLRALSGLGSSPEQVDFVFVTHVHLDHAGGAGRLLRALPNARAIAHPRAVPHLIDPSRLVAASREVYGAERFEALYGEPLPIPSERVHATCEGERLTLGGFELEVLHTPGHALHHHVLYDASSASVFTGDTFGLSYPDLGTERGHFIVPTTTPTQFDPDQLTASVARIVALEPDALYLTHYGRVTGVAKLGASLQAQIGELVAIARRHAASEQRRSAIIDEIWATWRTRLRDHGCRLDDAAVADLLRNDVELNADGLLAWLDRGARRS